MKQYTATANDEGVRLSRFVQSVTRDLPTSLLYKSFRKTASRPETSLSCTSTMSFSRRRGPSPPQKSRPKSSRTSPK